MAQHIPSGYMLTNTWEPMDYILLEMALANDQTGLRYELLAIGLNVTLFLWQSVLQSSPLIAQRLYQV